MRNTKRLFLALGVVVLGLVSVACGSKGADSTPTASAAAPTSSAMSKATVGVAQSSLGSILVDASGKTLYAFAKDEGTKSACSGGCAATWPALTVDKGASPSGAGIDDAKLGTAKRDDGTVQVTYAGHPLYHYSGDVNAGDTNGQGFGGVWHVVSTDGKPVTSTPAASPAPASTQPTSPY